MEIRFPDPMTIGPDHPAYRQDFVGADGRRKQVIDNRAPIDRMRLPQLKHLAVENGFDADDVKDMRADAIKQLLMAPRSVRQLVAERAVKNLAEAKKTRARVQRGTAESTEAGPVLRQLVLPAISKGDEEAARAEMVQQLKEMPFFTFKATLASVGMQILKGGDRSGSIAEYMARLEGNYEDDAEGAEAEYGSGEAGSESSERDGD